MSQTDTNQQSQILKSFSFVSDKNQLETIFKPFMEIVEDLAIQPTEAGFYAGSLDPCHVSLIEIFLNNLEDYKTTYQADNGEYYFNINLDELSQILKSLDKTEKYKITFNETESHEHEFLKICNESGTIEFKIKTYETTQSQRQPTPKIEQTAKIETTTENLINLLNSFGSGKKQNFEYLDIQIEHQENAEEEADAEDAEEDAEEEE